MPQSLKRILIILIVIPFLGCQSEHPVDVLESIGISGNVIVTTVATDPSTGPGIVSMFTEEGELVRSLEDLYATGTSYPAGSVFVPPESVMVAVEGVDSLHKIDITNKSITTITNAGLSATVIRQITRSTADGSYYIVEGGAAPQIEKFSSAGARVGNPFIPATTGACALVTPYGITYIPTNEHIAVVSSAAAGRLSIYDKDGNCISHTTASPFNAGTPSGVAYHALSGKLIVVRAGDHSIWSVGADGVTGPVQIYLNSGIINTPRSVTTDEDGYIYVGSSGTDTVEKLYYSGSGLASRALPGPLIGPGFYSQNVTSITVVPK